MIKSQKKFLLVVLLKQPFISSLVHPLCELILHLEDPTTMISYIFHSQLIFNMGLKNKIAHTHIDKSMLTMVYISNHIRRIRLTTENNHIFRVKRWLRYKFISILIHIYPKGFVIFSCCDGTEHSLLAYVVKHVYHYLLITWKGESEFLRCISRNLEE